MEDEELVFASGIGAEPRGQDDIPQQPASWQRRWCDGPQSRAGGGPASCVTPTRTTAGLRADVACCTDVACLH